eukprot:3313109-Prymnesium_polylepis.1
MGLRISAEETLRTRTNAEEEDQGKTEPLDAAVVAGIEAVGCEVVIAGILGRPELNGRSGVAQEFVVATGRVKVQVDHLKSPVLLKPENLLVLGSSKTSANWETLVAVMYALSLQPDNEQLRVHLHRSTDEARKQYLSESSRDNLERCMAMDSEAFRQVILIMDARLFCELVHMAVAAQKAVNGKFFSVLMVMNGAMDGGFDRYPERMELKLAAELILLCFPGPGERDSFAYSNQLDNCALRFDARIDGTKSVNQDRALGQFQAALDSMTSYDGVYVGPFVTKAIARIHDHLGSLYKHRINGERTANLEKSIEECTQSVPILEQTGTHRWSASSEDSLEIYYHNLALAYMSRSAGKRHENVRKAVELYEKAEGMIGPSRDLMWARFQTNYAAACSEFGLHQATINRCLLALNWYNSFEESVTFKGGTDSDTATLSFIGGKLRWVSHISGCTMESSNVRVLELLRTDSGTNVLQVPGDGLLSMDLATADDLGSSLNRLALLATSVRVELRGFEEFYSAL